MTENQSSIFRQEALRYRYGSDQPILPRFVSTTAFVSLWILTALLAGVGIAVWSTPLRAPISGVAVVIDARTVAAFLPAYSRRRLRVGQSLSLSTLRLSAADSARQFHTPIVSIDPEVVTAQAARRRYRLDPDIAQAISGPAAIAIARCESTAGSVYRVTVDGGSRSLFSVFPLSGRTLETRP